MMMYHVILGRFHLVPQFHLCIDITSPEITEEYEGGIEVQDEIDQISRDTSSLQDITSPEITNAFVFFSNFWTGDIL
jgi:hypothetical protein